MSTLPFTVSRMRSRGSRAPPSASLMRSFNAPTRSMGRHSILPFHSPRTAKRKGSSREMERWKSRRPVEGMRPPSSSEEDILGEVF